MRNTASSVNTEVIMTKYAVCFHQTERSFALWVVVAAESARDAVEQVRQEYTVHDVVGVYKEQVRWKWE